MPPIVKEKPIRSKALREGGRGMGCVLCGRDVHSGAHLPHSACGFPGGRGIKAPDWLLADLCDQCHHKMDGPEWRNDHETRMRALCLTLQRRFDQGILTVKGQSFASPWL